MIKLHNISLQRGSNILLDAADLVINPGEKVALIGHNGAGKSSLFGLLTGQLSLDQGELFYPADWRVVSLEQEIVDLQRPAVDYVLDGDRKLRQLQHDLAQAEAKDDDQALIRAHSALDAYQAYQVNHLAEAILEGLGFSSEQLYWPTGRFSGGWRMRINLARALLTPSDLLLLDEPTNHLDLDALLWLEKWLMSYQGTLVFIAHDRSFIDQVANHIVHIDGQQLHRWRGNYSAWERQRAEQIAQQQAQQNKVMQQRAHLQSYIDRFKAKASKAKQAQSRIKALARLEDQALVRLDSQVQFRLPAREQMSDPILSLRNANLGYEHSILDKVSLDLRPGSRIGLLGMNGAGKSTLIASLTGKQPLLGGERIEGHHCFIGHFAQHQLEAMDAQQIPLNHLQRLFPALREQQLRDHLGSFGFNANKVETQIDQLSGGERARLALAELSLASPNLLLLDEPTNHLDLNSRQALSEALLAYPGALLLVSHDRSLMNDCVDDLYLVHQGRVQAFNGDLSDYQQWLKEQQKQSKAGSDRVEDKEPDKKAKRQQAAAQRELLKPLQKQSKQFEKQQQKLEQQLQQLQEQLQDTSLYEESNKTKLQSLLQQQGKLKQELDQCELDWMDVLEQLETLSA